MRLDGTMNVACKRVHLQDDDMDCYVDRDPDHLGVRVNAVINGWLCLASHRQRGHLETAPTFTVPCEGREAR